MKGRRVLVYLGLLLVIGLFGFIVLSNQSTLTLTQLTGFAVFDQFGPSFSNGTHVNTTYNGSHIVLSLDNISGEYLSEVLDAGNDAYWNNMTLVQETPFVHYLYAVDGSGAVYSSTDLTSWTQETSDYGRGSDTTHMFNDVDYLYILAQSNKELYRSANGTDYILVNSTFADSSIFFGSVDSAGDLFIVDGSGDVYRSTNQGMSFTKRGDFNGGATNNPKGMAISSGDVIYIIDGGKNLFKSSNAGTSWTSVSHDYGGGSGLEDMTIDSNDDLYILDGKDIWKSNNSGVNWTKINDSFTPYSPSGQKISVSQDDTLYIPDGNGLVFSSSDAGQTWIEETDFNGGASNNPKGISEFLKPTDISVEYRNCSLANCSDASWTTGDLLNLSVVSRYFQYKVLFTSPEAGKSSYVQNVTVDYDLVNEAPLVTIIEPKPILYLSNESLALNYTVVDQDDNLDACWYNFDGGSNTTLLGCGNTTFNITEGEHTLNLFANDTLGLLSLVTLDFDVDATGVFVSITDPIGTKTSRTGIALTYSMVGNNLTCVYNVETSIGGSVIENTTIPGCNATTFDVATDGDYVVYLHVNNTLGSSDYSNSSFTVDTSSGGGSGGSGSSGGGSGGGGGGGSTGGFSSKAILEVENVSAIMSLGEEKSLQAVVKNTGFVAANKCKLVAEEPHSDLIEANEIVNIGAGEIVEFSFVLKATKEDADNMSLSVSCFDDVKGIVPLRLKLFKPSLDISISQMQFIEGPALSIDYEIDSLTSSREQLVFTILDDEDNVVSELEESIKLEKGVISGNIILNLQDAPRGLLKISVSKKGVGVVLIEETVIYDGSVGITGRAVGALGGFSALGIMIILFATLMLLVSYRIFKVHRGTASMHTRETVLRGSGTVQEMIPGTDPKSIYETYGN